MTLPLIQGRSGAEKDKERTVMAEFWCDVCHNTGELDCRCCGDLCLCLNYGTYPCPHCDGGRAQGDTDDDEWFEDDAALYQQKE